jgi:hypothetical protein
LNSHSEWWLAKAERTGNVGLIPSNYVERIEPGEGKFEVISECKGIALYDYSRDCAGTFTLYTFPPELTFQKDDVIDLSRIKGSDIWYRGKLGNKEGWVHPSYLLVLSDSEY